MLGRGTRATPDLIPIAQPGATTVPAPRVLSGRLAVRCAIDGLRLAPWVTRRRLMFYGALFAALSVFLIGYGFALDSTNGLTSERGEQLGLDFVNFYAGAKAAAGGKAALAYDHRWFHALEDSLAGPGYQRYYVYPPVAMLLSVPLAALPYVPALAVWTLIGVGLGFLLLRRLVGWRAAGLTVIGTPAAFLDIYGGQNGYFTTALVAGGLMILERRPAVAGICFGCLIYKPQMALLVPIALVAGGRWRVLAVAAVAASVLVLASLALFGSASWAGFFEQSTFQRHFFEFDEGFIRRMQTVFAGTRELGVGVPGAYATQAVSSVAAAALTAAIWRRAVALELKSAALIVAIFLSTPFAWDYDAVMLPFAAAWLGREGLRTGFLPWERLAIVVLLILPLPTFVVAWFAGIHLGPLLLWLAFGVICRRALAVPDGIAARSTGPARA